MKKKLLKLSGLSVVAGFLSPLIVLAQQTTGQNQAICTRGITPGNLSTIQTVICKFNDILAAILPFLIALGIVYFVWGVITYVISSDEEAKKTGRNRMIYGLIGLVVIVGVWAIVRWVTNTFGLGNSTQIEFPTVPY